MSSFLLTTLVISTLVATGNLKDDVKELDGAWAPVSANFGGLDFREDLLKTMKLKMKNGEYTVMVGKSTDRGTVKIDAAKSPRHMDIIGTEGPNKGKTFLSIYELDKDTLKICYDLAGKERPTEFAVKPQSQQFLVVYKRIKE
jgi:uncharacterized protein (TIGR03067 family)